MKGWTRWRKVIGDLGAERWQMIAIAAALLLSSIVTAASFGAKAILEREVARSFGETNPPGAILYVENIPKSLLGVVVNVPSVRAAERRRVIRARVEASPGRWLPLRLFIIDDFSRIEVARVHSHSGAWPPPDEGLLIEQSALPMLGDLHRGSLTVRVPGGGREELLISGVAHDPGQAPGWQDQILYAYATPQTAQSLGLGESFDELDVVFNVTGREEIARAASALGDVVARNGGVLRRIEVPLGEHPHADHMRTMLLLIQVFGSLALLLASVLTANVLGMILARQTRQIGIMKTLGASSAQIGGMFFVMIAVVAVPAVTAGIFLGARLGVFFAQSVSPMLNLEVGSWEIPGQVLGLIGLFALGVPLLTSMIPILRAARITPRAAIQHAGITPLRLAALGKRHAGWDRSIVLALRNTLRRPIRLLLTVFALGIGGALFLTALNVYAGLIQAVDDALLIKNTDIEIQLLQPAAAASILAAIDGIPGVESADGWGMALATVQLGRESGGRQPGTSRYSLLAPTVPLANLGLPLIEGRWPQAGELAVIVNRHFLDREKSAAVGREITLRVGDRQATVLIAGVVEELGQPALYCSRTVLPKLGSAPSDIANLRVTASKGVPLDALALAIENKVVDQGWFPAFVVSRTDFRKALVDHFKIVLMVLSATALAAVAIGGISLTTTTSINVLERARETGILRAIGATPKDILGIFTLEGAVVGTASWSIATVGSLPLTALVGAIVARHGLHVSMPFVFSGTALGVWIVLAATVTAGATILPARRAIRVSVREALVMN